MQNHSSYSKGTFSGCRTLFSFLINQLIAPLLIFIISKPLGKVEQNVIMGSG